MMQTSKNSSIKLGRVSKSVERALESSFPGDVFIYIKEKNLNAFAVKYPSDYLRRLNVIKDIISRPHFAAYLKEEKTIYLFRTYYHNGVFKTFSLAIKKEKCWEFLSLTKASERKPLDQSMKVNEIENKRT